MTEDIKPKIDEKSSTTKWKILVVILAVLLLLTGGTMIFWGGVPFFSAFAPNDSGSASQGTGLVVDPNAGEYVPEEQPPGVVIQGFGKLTIPPYTTKITDINLYNSQKNEGWYYLTFKICLLDENGEVSETLYESQLLPPGLYLQDIVLSHGLSPGEYNALMQVQPYRIADLTPTNRADLRFVLIVK